MSQLNFQATPEILRLPEMCRCTGLSRSSIYALVKKNQLPRPIKISQRASGWLRAEVLQWVEEKAAQRGGNA